MDMGKATFYTHVADRSRFICRLCQRAVESGGRVLVWSDSIGELERVDADLWRFPPEGFLPHEFWQGGAYPADVPVVLAGGVSDGPLSVPDSSIVVLNLSPYFWCQAAAPPDRVLEIVGESLEELAEARDRFRAYKASGFEIEHHTMQGKA